MRKKRLLAGFIAFLLFFVVAAPLLQEIANALAASTIGTLNGKAYTSFDKLYKDLKNNYKGESVVIDMTANWNAAGKDEFDQQLCISSGCSAVLNMHGYVFNRNRGWNNKSTGDGGLFFVESNATLTINGYTTESEKNVKHDLVATFNSVDGDTAANKSITTYGGTLTGGNSDDESGGIHILSGSTVTLNDVTIAGCKADTYWGLHGYGGAVYMSGGKNTLRLNRSTITGCFANNHGGAIYITNDKNVAVEMRDSVIDRNFANEKGGGIFMNGEYNYVNGYSNSEVKNNSAGTDGGGFYTDKENANISDLTLTGNRAVNGAGIYVSNEETTISNLVVKNNTASKRGGGFYIQKESCTLSSCEVTNNGAGISGGGVYVNEDVDENFNVTGSFICRNNTAHNFYISDSDPDDTRVMFNLTKGADVHVSYYDTEDKDAIMVTTGEKDDEIKSPNCIRYLTADNSGYHFTFNAKPNYRKIFYVKNGKDNTSAYGSPDPDPVDPTKVTPENAINNPGQASTDTKAGIVGTVGPGGYEGTDYNLIRGFTMHQETDNDKKESYTAFYYTDAFFDDSVSPKTYNEHLATASLNMAYAGMYLRVVEDEINGNTYYNKHAGGRQFLADIGCPDQNIYINDSNEKKPGTDTIGVTIGSKELAKADGTKTGKILIPVTIRGGGYELEWASNATLGRASDVQDKEAQGFSEAATQVVSEIDKYIKKYSLEDELSQGNIIFWVTGYSRAGATANISSKRLIEKYASGSGANGNNKVFAYTCEAPRGGTDDGEHLRDKTAYYCIHNLINAVDIVPLVAPWQMGFKRYGVDHHIPGTQAGSVQSEYAYVRRGGTGSPRSMSRYWDNDYLYIKSEVSSSTKAAMEKQLRAVDSGIVMDDYFHPMGIRFIPSVKIYEEGDYDGNNIEDFIRDFLRLAQEGKYPYNYEKNWSQAISNRDQWADEIQPVMRDTLSMIMTMDSETSSSFIGRASRLMGSIPTTGSDLSQRELWDELIGDWHKLSSEKKSHYTTKLWDKLAATGALDALSSEDRAKLHSNWPTLLDFILRLVDGDYGTEINDDSIYGTDWAAGADDYFMYLITFATYANYILQNHYPEVNLAWARTYDSYYNNETKEYVVDNSNYTVSAPSATGTEVDSDGTVDEVQAKALVPGDTINKLYGDQKIILEVDDIVGEAIYYDLKDDVSGKVLATNAVYKGGIDLPLGEELGKSYTLTTYAMSYEVKSSTTVYNIEQLNDRFKVTVNDRDDQKLYFYKAEDKVTIGAQYGQSSDAYFMKWTASLYDADDNKVAEDIADRILTKNVATADFVMPKLSDKYDDTHTYPENYSLEFNAVYGDRIRHVVVGSSASLIEPISGQTLSTDAKMLFTSGDRNWVPEDEQGNEISYPVSWTYSYEDPVTGETKVSPGSGNAYSKAVYTATITIPQDVASGIVFAPTDSLTGEWTGGPSDITDFSISRNDSNGSATIVITFAETDDGGILPPEAEIRLTVKSYDLNLESYIDDAEQVYHVSQGDAVTITAPNVEDEVFYSWDLGEDGIVPVGESDSTTIQILILNGQSTSDLEICANYVPVINNIDVNVEVPEGGKTMQTVAADTTLKVTISNEYIIHPDNVSISWSPEPLDVSGEMTADYMTAYTATVGIKPSTDENGDYILVKKPDDTDYERISATFIYSEGVASTVNGEKAVCDKDNNSVSYTFPVTKYKLVHIDNPDNISDIAHGTGEEELKSLLPATVKILTDSGAELDAEVTWTLSKGTQTDAREEVIWTAKGVVTLPDMVVNTDDIPLDQLEVKLTVKEADYAAAPVATLGSGVFLANQQTSLETNEAGGTTYYTLDGTDPTTSATRIEYSGETIMINREDATLDETVMDDDGQQVSTGRKKISLNAVTFKDGKWDSATVTYEYIFTNDVPLPSVEELTYNGEGQSAISGSGFYTVESVSNGGWVTADGEAAAKNAGTYKVTLKVKPGYQWELDDGTSEENQTIEFTIKPLSLEDAEIVVLSDPVHANGTEIKPEIRVTLNGITLSPDDYDVIYTDNVASGKGKIKITGKGNYTGEKGDVTFDILPAEYSITFNLNGGTLNGATGHVVEKHEEGTVIKLPLPVRDGYEFDYWKGSQYKAGDEYTIVGDHTFEAIWREPGNKKSDNDSDDSSAGQDGQKPADPDSSGKSSGNSEKGNSINTGDNAQILVGFIALIISLFGIVGTLIIRRRIDDLEEE